jgi:hypothetical protein
MGDAISFGDLVGKTEWLAVACRKCDRVGRYRMAGLVAQHGAGKTIPAWLEQLTSDCPRRKAVGIHDRCGVNCPDLTKIV